MIDNTIPASFMVALTFAILYCLWFTSLSWQKVLRILFGTLTIMALITWVNELIGYSVSCQICLFSIRYSGAGKITVEYLQTSWDLCDSELRFHQTSTGPYSNWWSTVAFHVTRSKLSVQCQHLVIPKKECLGISFPQNKVIVVNDWWALWERLGGRFTVCTCGNCPMSSLKRSRTISVKGLWDCEQTSLETGWKAIILHFGNPSQVSCYWT